MCGFDGAEVFGGSPKGLRALRGTGQVRVNGSAGATWKGFTLTQLERFGVKRTDRGGIEVPYFTTEGQPFRSKVFLPNGRSYWLPGSGQGQIPYGLEQLGGDLPHEAVVLTEGESDALALRLAFPDAIVLGLPGASSWRTEWRVHVEDFRRIYLSFDADQAGRKLLERVKQDISEYRTIQLPDGADTRDVIQQLGKRAYKVLVDVADTDYEIRCGWRRLDVVNRRRQRVDLAWQNRSAA